MQLRHLLLFQLIQLIALLHIPLQQHLSPPLSPLSVAPMLNAQTVIDTYTVTVIGYYGVVEIGRTSFTWDIDGDFSSPNVILNSYNYGTIYYVLGTPALSIYKGQVRVE